jgi:hypothetical protein
MKIQLYTGPSGSGKTRRLRAAVAHNPKVLDLTGSSMRAIKRLVAHHWSPDTTIVIDEADGEIHQFLHRSEHPGQAHIVLRSREPEPHYL